MLWNPDISFEGFQKKIESWYEGKDSELCDPPISAQFALDLIFKTLIDNKENYPYLTTIPESTEQTNSIMLDLILTKYSRKYRKFKRRRKMSIFTDYSEHFERRMRDIDLEYGCDPEVCHQKMEECMCEALEEFGCYDGVQVFKERFVYPKSLKEEFDK